MSFLNFFSRTAEFDAKVFIKNFCGNKNEFKKLNKNELDCLLRMGLIKSEFPVEMLIEYLIEIKFNFNEPLKDGFLPLNLACSSGNIKAVKKMIEGGADVHAKDATQVGALGYACRSGNLKLVEYLLSLNVEVNSRDASNRSPIFYAVEIGNYEIFALLIERGADIKTPTETGTTLLHSSVSHNYIQMVEKLLEIGADINAEDNNGRNVLDYTRRKDYDYEYVLGDSYTNLDMITKLVELGAPIAKYSQNSDCWVELVGMFDNIDMLKLVIANGAKLYRKDLNILFSINEDSSYQYYDEDYKKTSLNAIEYLLSLDLDINQQCPRSGKTPLMQICTNGTLEQVILLLKHGANPFLTDYEGKTTIHYAALGGNSDIIAHLINNYEMNPNIRSLNGQTPLHLFRYSTTLKALIKLGADVNAQDNQKQTPLHVFTQKRHHYNVDLLLKHGARNDILDINSNRPIDLCLENMEMIKVYSKYSMYRITALEPVLLCFRWNNNRQ